MLKLYSWNEVDSQYDELSVGTMLMPLNLVAQSLRGQDARVTDRMYLRNDEDNTLYTDIEVQFVDIPSSWRAKIIPQVSEPTKEDFLALPNGNIATHDDISDKSYYPVWVEVIVPQGTTPAVFAGMKLKIATTREVA